MNEAPAVADVERRKLVRLRMRRDLDIAPQKYEGRTYYVVKDPVSLRYYRFKEQEHFLIKLMDGGTTLDDAQKAYENRFRPERLTLEDLEGFGQQLLTAGLAQNESPQAGKQLFDRRKKRRRSEWMQTLTNILYIKIPVFDPDKLLTKMLPYLNWIFTTWFMMLSIGVMLAAVLLVATHFETFYERWPSYHEFFSVGKVASMWIALGLVKIIHEFGHGLSCKAFKGEVHEMGFLFLVFSPCLYCNVSDAWTLPNKWKRIIISFAGIYVELIIAAIATFVWWNTPALPFVNNLSLSLMVVCSVSTVVFNANPLMRYDGYYILADLLEIPNLRDRSNRYLSRLAMEHFLGIEMHPEPYMELWRRILFVAYAVISYVYRWVITFSILWFMSQFLKPYKLGVISGMLAFAAAASQVGWPIYRLGKNIYKRGRLPDMSTIRVTLTSIAVAGILFFVFFVPLPVSRVRATALVQVEPGKIAKTIISVPGGVLEKLNVKDGQRVREGDVLAVFSAVELENKREEYRTQRDINQSEMYNTNGLIQSLGSRLPPEDRARYDAKVAQARGEFGKFRDLVEAADRELAKLEVRAPCDGLVMSPPHTDEIGKSYQKGETFCSVGDPATLRVYMPVSPAEYRLLVGDRRKLQAEGKDLSVTIRLKGRDSRTWEGEVELLPESEAKEIPVQLTNKAGGDIAVKPGTKPGVYIPQTQQYMIGIRILNPDNAMAPGTLAQAKIHCRWRTGAWWAWRSFNSAFDLGMDWTDFVPMVDPAKE